MDVVVTIDQFTRHLTAGGTYAAITVETYEKNLALFKRHLVSHGIDDLRKVTGEMIADYQARVMAEPLAMETKATRLRPVKRLFEHLTETHRLLVNPTEAVVETCRRDRKIGHVLTVAEVEALLAEPDLSVPTELRNRAVLEVLYSTAIRLSELLALEPEHIDLTAGMLFVRKGKGGKQRAVPLGKEACRYLAEYMDRVRPKYAVKQPQVRSLFLTHSGGPLADHSVREFLRKYRMKAGITKPVSPYTFRRSLATHLLQQGVDIRHIQELLGHERLSTTQTYTKVLPTEVKETHRATHPGRRLK